MRHAIRLMAWVTVLIGVGGSLLTGQQTLVVPTQYKTISAALAAAKRNDTVLVGPGFYRENLRITTHIHLKSIAGPYLTILDGGGKGPVIELFQGAGRTIEGFTIQNGINPGKSGGGIYAPPHGDPMIRNNIIQHNRAHNGGGVWAWGATRVIGNRIEHNVASNGGGGVYFGASSGGLFVVQHNAISGNKCTVDGGGIHMDGSGAFSLDVSHNVFAGNEAGRDGGALHCCDGVMAANNFHGNRAGRNGGALYLRASSSGPWGIESNTFAANRATNGGGLYISDWGTRFATSCIFWQNLATSAPEIQVGPPPGGPWGGAQLDMDHCLVSGGKLRIVVSKGSTLNWGTGMQTKDPLFADEPGGDLHIRWGSPCIGAGRARGTQPLTDFEGDPRGATIDIGADEFAPRFYLVGDPRRGRRFGLRMIGVSASSTHWGVSAAVRSPPVLVPGLGTLYLADPFVAWPASALDTRGLHTLWLDPPWWFPVPRRFVAQALIGSRLTNSIQVWIR